MSETESSGASDSGANDTSNPGTHRPAQGEKPRGYSWKLLAGLMLLVAVGAFCARFAVDRRADGQQVADNLVAMDGRVDALEKVSSRYGNYESRLKSLEENVQKLASAPPPLAVTTASSSGASNEAVVPVQDARLVALEKEIAQLKATTVLRDNASISQSIRVLSALHRLSDKVIGGKPFAAELATFEDIASLDQSAGTPVATLAPYADSGIPTFATLLASFDQSVEVVNAAEAVPPAGADFWTRFKFNMSHLVTVRRIDEAQPGNKVNDILGRAQGHLEREEIEAAMAEVKSLPEAARNSFSAWLDDAQIASEAPSLIAQIEDQVMQKVFKTDATPAPQETPPDPDSVSPSSSPKT